MTHERRPRIQKMMCLAQKLTKWRWIEKLWQKRKIETTWQDRVPRVHTGVSKGDMQVNIKHKEVNIC